MIYLPARSRFGKGREERLIEFSVLIIEIVKEMPDSKTGNHNWFVPGHQFH